MSSSIASFFSSFVSSTHADAEPEEKAPADAEVTAEEPAEAEEEEPEPEDVRRLLWHIISMLNGIL